MLAMASSNAGQAPKWGKDGLLLDCSFASYLERRKDRNLHQPVVMHVSLLQPAKCRHCKRWENLRPSPARRPAAPPGPNGRECAVSLPGAAAATTPRELALGLRSCFKCAEEVCRETRYLRDAAPASVGGDTPLHHAARSGNLRMLCHLLTLVGEEGGHDRALQVLRKPNEREETALHAAFSVPDIRIFKLLLWVDPHVDRIRWPATAPSPMYLAVSMRRMDIAEALHDAAAGLSYDGPNGQNALHAAALWGGSGMTYKLLTWDKNLIQKDKNGRTPLHFAVSVVHYCPYIVIIIRSLLSRESNRKEDVQTSDLLDADSSMAYEPDHDGLYPVHIAAMTNQRVALHILLTRCPGCIGLRDKQGRTFLHVAVQNKACAVVNYVSNRRRFKFASIVNIQDVNGNTALHLAVKATHLGMVSDILSNETVCLNLMNNMGQTALDIAKSKICRGFFSASNPDKVIYKLLRVLRGGHSSCVWDIKEVTSHDVDEKEESKKATSYDVDEKEESKKVTSHDVDEKEESKKLTSSTQVLGIGAVLIATVAFGATFSLPGGYIADDHPNGGTPTLGGRWYFHAFMVANTLAFICSSVATIGLMFAGIAMVSLPERRMHFNISVFFVQSSVTCLTTAFALGVYMLLARVARRTVIAICSISPLVLLYTLAGGLLNMVFCSWALYRRGGGGIRGVRMVVRNIPQLLVMGAPQ